MSFLLRYVILCILFTVMNHAAHSQILSLSPRQQSEHYFHGGPPVPVVYFTVSGKVITEKGTALNGTTLFVSGGISDSMKVSYNGVYHFDLPAGENYDLFPACDGDSAINGISTLDMLYIRRHILFLNPLETPYKVIAADVDRSGAVTTLDFLLTRSIVLQINRSFPDDRVWVFVSSSQVFADSLRPFPYEAGRSYVHLAQNHVRQDFIAVKLGDVNNSWDPNSPKDIPAGEMNILIDEAVQSAGVVSLPFRVSDFRELTGFQFTVSWNADELSYEGVQNRSLECFFGDKRAGEGFLCVSWMSETTAPVTLNDSAEIFELNFLPRGNAAAVSEIEINSSLAPAEAYNAGLETVSIPAAKGKVSLNSGLSAIYSPFLLYPNPVKTSSELVFTLEKAGAVSIFWFDIAGNKTQILETLSDAGTHHLPWPGNNHSLKNGIYFISIRTPDNFQILKAVVAR